MTNDAVGIGPYGVIAESLQLRRIRRLALRRL